MPSLVHITPWSKKRKIRLAVSTPNNSNYIDDLLAVVPDYERESGGNLIFIKLRYRWQVHDLWVEHFRDVLCPDCFSEHQCPVWLAHTGLVDGPRPWWWLETPTRCKPITEDDMEWAALLLGVSGDAAARDIRRAARRAAFLVHPDRGGSLDGIRRVLQARDELLNRSWRADR